MVEKRELKGLDIIRRDWSGLAKRSGQLVYSLPLPLSPHVITSFCSYVLDQILSGAPLDDVIDRVLSFLVELKLELENNKVPLEEFVITKVWDEEVVGVAIEAIPSLSPLVTDQVS